MFARHEPDPIAKESDYEAIVARGVLVRADGVECPAKYGGARADGDRLVLAGTFACAPGARSVDATFYFLSELPAGHTHVSRLRAGGSTVESVLSPTSRQIAIETGAPPRAPSFSGRVAAGAWHILSGWDHLLFLAMLAIGVPYGRKLLAAVTAFTVAHSITLALATLGVVAIPAAWVEPAIALSIAYVAIGNVRRREAHGWPVAFAFGLVHGFGFADGLQVLGLERARVAVALVGFNLGVECGQIAVLLALVPLVRALQRERSGRAIQGVSLLAAGVAIALCVSRLRP